MFLRRVTQTPYGPVIDTFPGHCPDYLLLIRIDEPKISQLEAILPKGWAPCLTGNMGDRRCYSFLPKLSDKERITDITEKLIELGVQSFEFRDWTNKICPPTRERIIETKKSIFKI